jgi:hypothetical protein
LHTLDISSVVTRIDPMMQNMISRMGQEGVICGDR